MSVIFCLVRSVSENDGWPSTLHYTLPNGFRSRLGATLTFKLYKAQASRKVIAEFQPQRPDHKQSFWFDSDVPDNAIEPAILKLVQRKLLANGVNEVHGFVRDTGQRKLGRLLNPTEIGRSP